MQASTDQEPACIFEKSMTEEFFGVVSDLQRVKGIFNGLFLRETKKGPEARSPLSLRLGTDTEEVSNCLNTS